MKKYINVSITGIEISEEKFMRGYYRGFEDLFLDYCSKHFGFVRGDIQVEECDNIISFEEGLEYLLDEGYDIDYDDGEESEEEKCFTCPCCDEYIYKVDYPMLFLATNKNKKFCCPVCKEEI